MLRDFSKRQRGFTLLELIIVIAIITVLCSLLLATVQKVRAAADRTSCANNLGQIGLAMQHYNDQNNALPPWGFDFTFNPNPSNPLGSQTMGHSAFALILPYLEQQNVADIVRNDLSVIDPLNWPPPWGQSVGGSAQIKTYMCPSSPQRTINYEEYFVALGLPDAGPFILGQTDYAIVAGNSIIFTTAYAPQSPGEFQPQRGVGAMGLFGQMSPAGMMPGTTTTLADITDGLSTTVMVSEDAGRTQVYAKGQSLYPNGYNEWGYTQSSAWGDYTTYIEVHGYSDDGLTRDAGSCVINCNNTNQFYSFHGGGVNGLRADGSVRFMSDQMTPAILAALVSRAGGEAFQDDE